MAEIESPPAGLAVYATRRGTTVWSTYGQFANGDRAGAYADTLLHDFGASFDHVIVEDLTTGTKHVITTSDGHEIAHANDN